MALVGMHNGPLIDRVRIFAAAINAYRESSIKHAEVRTASDIVGDPGQLVGLLAKSQQPANHVSNTLSKGWR
jgi:hypothetical protein